MLCFDRVTSEKKPKALIHIGGSYLQLPGIRWAKELGLRLILTDKNPEAPCRPFADRFELISGTDIPELLELAQRVQSDCELVGSYTSSDFGLPAVAAIGEEFHFPGCSPVSVSRALDKSTSKDIWRREDVRTPQGLIVKDRKALLSATVAFGFPVIIKPADSSGSQGVRSVWNEHDILPAYKEARRFSGAILIEQFVAGHHIDVNGLFAEGEFIPCGTMDRFFSEPPYHYPVWGCQPSSLNTMQEGLVFSLVEKAARALGITAGPVKADIVWTDDGPVIIELAPRFHGDTSTARITPLATGGNPIKAWMAYLKGTEDWLKYVPKERVQFAGWMALFAETAGKLSSVEGVDTAGKKKGIKDIFISKKAGAAIVQPEDNRAVCGFVWAVDEERDALFENLKAARDNIRFITR